MSERTYTPPSATNLGFESNLSGYVGPYVTEMLGRGRAAASQPYQEYRGPLTAGESDLQQQAYTGIAGLTDPGSTMGGTYSPASFTANLETPMTITDPLGIPNEAGVMPTTQINTVAGQYMNPYIQQALVPQIDELRRQAEISRMENAQRLTGAGAFGGTRQAIMDAELDRNLLRSVSDLGAREYASAYDRAVDQYNREVEAQRLAQDFANQYGFDVFDAQRAAGEERRGILGEGIKADYGQFIEERDFPLKQTQFMQSLLQELPLETQQQMYAPPDPTSSGIATAGGILDLIGDSFD